jgi:GNAT superfamily N-acetyltransferase
MQSSPDDLSARGPSSPEGLETPNSGAPPATHLPWIPIRSLAPRHRDRILQHLLALSEHDRYLRFGYPAADAQISRYVDGLDFNRDELFGVFNRRLSLIAMAHLACPAPAEPGSDAPRSGEFGVSVSAHARGRGYGARLFEHAVLHARNRGLNQLFIHALSENTAMLKIVRQAGAEVHRAGSESDAYLSLPPETWASQVEQLVDTSAAALDYQLKLQAHFVGSMMGVGGGGDKD